jgi:hypothetical protein
LKVATQQLFTHQGDGNLDGPFDLDDKKREEVEELGDLGNHNLILDYADKVFHSKYRVEKIRISTPDSRISKKTDIYQV